MELKFALLYFGLVMASIFLSWWFILLLIVISVIYYVQNTDNPNVVETDYDDRH